MSTPSVSHSLNPAVSWNEFKLAFEGIFERQYYTENGPLVRQLEHRLGEHKQAAHVVAVMNEFVAYLMLLDSLPREGALLIPSKAPAALQQALSWLPQFTPVRYAQPANVMALLTPKTCAVLGTSEQWSEAVAAGLQAHLLATGTPLILDCSDEPLRPLVHAHLHICAMHASCPLSAMEGAYMALSDTDWADRLRTMRSSSGAPRTMPVKKTVNGRLSEAHAAIALLNLQQSLSKPTQACSSL